MTITIAKLLDRNEYDVRFVVIGREIGEIKELIPADYPLSLVKIRNIYDFTTLRLYGYLQKVKPQFVFCSLHYLNPRVIQAARWVGGCKIIIRFNCAVNRVHGINKNLTARTYPKADVIIAQTEKMQSDLESTYHLDRSKVITLHNMIDKETIAAKLKDAPNPYKDENRKVFVWVGRYDKVKGPDVLIEAFEIAYKRDSGICLYMVGKTDEGSEAFQAIRKIVNERQLEGNVVFTGFQDNPYKWMKNADCFILSSRSEGSPNALFEALYLGVPSVATRCTPNIDDIITDGVNGYKVEIGDSEDLAKKMLLALTLTGVKSIYTHSTQDDFKRLFQ